MNSDQTRSNRLPALDPWLIPAALLPIIAFVALLRPGIANTADGLVHLLRTLQVAELMKSGVLYPQWAPDFYFGYGYPFFLFYAPGAHMLAAGLALLGLSVVTALVAVQAFSLFLYSIGAYLAARSFFRGLASPRIVSMAALGAAALYVFTPLRMRELFLQGNLSQLLALAILPWCLWALLAAARSASSRAAAGAGLLLAAMLYAHHPSALLAFPLLGLLGLASARLEDDGRRWRAAGAVVAAFVLALLLSAPFVVPWLLESSYGSLQRMESGPFNAALNLVPWNELFAPAALLDATSINSPWPLSLGLLQAILAGLGVGVSGWLAWRRSPGRAHGRAPLLVAAALLAACIALMLPLAAPLWTHLPLAKYIAFPWRLLGPAGLLAAVLGATPLLLLPERGGRLALLLVLLLAPLNVAAYLFPPASLWRPAPAGGLTLADIGRYEVANNWRGTTSANEYLPRWVEDPDPPLVLLQDYEAGRLPQRLDTASLPAGSQAAPLRTTPLENIYRLDLAEPMQVTIRSFYYPGWRAWVDGQEAAILPGAPYGLITVAVPAGMHELRVAWGTTGPRTAGWVLFAVGMALVVGMGIFTTKKVSLASAHRAASPENTAHAEGAEAHLSAQPLSPLGSLETSPKGLWQDRRSWWLATALIVLLAGAKILWVEPHTGWFRLQSPADAPRSMTHPLHIRFANGVELLGYDLPREAVRQGGRLAVRLYWRTHEDLNDDLRSFVHLVSPEGDVTWANQTKEHAGDMPASNWPIGFFVVDEYRLTVPDDTPPVRTLLRVGLIDSAGQRVPVARAGGGDIATVAQIVVEGKSRPFVRRPNSGDSYRLGDSITLAGYSATLQEGSQAGREIRLTLYWRTDRELDVDYTVFVHLIGDTGARVGQGDGPACGGACPTTSWTPGGIIEDTRIIPLPAGGSNEGLHVLVGLYDAKTDTRLPVRDRRGADQPEGAIRIPVLTVSGL